MDPGDNEYNWPHAAVTLVDALRGYIRISEQTRRDLIELTGHSDIDEPHLNRCRALLKEMEEKHVDPYINNNLGSTRRIAAMTTYKRARVCCGRGQRNRRLVRQRPRRREAARGGHREFANGFANKLVNTKQDEAARGRKAVA